MALSMTRMQNLCIRWDAVRAAGVSDERSLLTRGLGFSKPEISWPTSRLSVPLPDFQAWALVLIGWPRKGLLRVSPPALIPCAQGQGSTGERGTLRRSRMMWALTIKMRNAGLSALIAERGAWAAR